MQHMTSQEGFDAEWRGIAIFTVEGDMVSRTEVFDEADLAPPSRGLISSANRHHGWRTRQAGTERFAAHLRARDWTPWRSWGDDFCSDDRRGVVGAGIQHGRDAHKRGHANNQDLDHERFDDQLHPRERLVLMRTHFRQ
jgi:hypothetical protein